MSEFRERLRSIRKQAEDRASRLGHADDARARSETDTLHRMQESATGAGDLLEALLESFAEEYPRFEKTRVIMEGEHCIRLSNLEQSGGSRTLSRLTFTIAPRQDEAGLLVTGKGVIFNREYGHEELELPVDLDEETRATLRSFAEQVLLSFATDYEEQRVESHRSSPS
jgi:hypothetical protein